jgi:hypothetical protein
LIRGGFAVGRAYVLAQISVPRLGRVEYILFLIDTGADITVIQPPDLIKLGIDAQRDLPRPTAHISGISGGSTLSVEPCVLQFIHTDGVINRLEIPLHFAEPIAVNAESESLLGWDVLRDYRLTLENQSGLVALDYPLPS